MKFEIIDQQGNEPVLKLRLEKTINGVVELVGWQNASCIGHVIARLYDTGEVDFPKLSLEKLGLKKRLMNEV